MTEAIRRVIGLVKKAQAITQELRQQDPEDHLLVYADKQLTVMIQVLMQGRVPTDDEKHKINLGLMAIREFEGGPLNEYALVLEEASGAFHSLS